MATISDEPGNKHIVHLYDSFQHDGPNGTHEVVVTNVVGPTLEALQGVVYVMYWDDPRYYAYPFPLPAIKGLVSQLLEALSFLKRCGIIYGGMLKF